MPRSIQSKPSREAAPLLATCLTLMYGVIACAFVIAFYSSKPLTHMLIVVGVSLGLAVVLWILRRVAPTATADVHQWIFGDRREDPLAGYSARPKRHQATQFGDQEPATLEEIRRIQERTNANVWVPAKDRD